MFTTMTSKLGVDTGSTQHQTERAAVRAANKAIVSGRSDSAAIYIDHAAVRFFGTGR